MEVKSYLIFKDWFTLYYKDKKIQKQYMQDKYKFWRIILCLSIYFVCFVTLLGLGLRVRFNDAVNDLELRISIGLIVFFAVMAFATMIFMLSITSSKTKNWFLNAITSLYLNFTHFLLFEAFKIIVYTLTLDRTSVFVLTIIEFGTKGAYLFFVDDNFVYNLFCYSVFLPIYLLVFTNFYSYSENELGFFIILFSFLAVGIYFIERIFKISYFGRATYKKEVERTRNLVDLVKSGFIVINLKTGKIEINKTMRDRYLNRLLQGTNCPDKKLSIFNPNLKKFSEINAEKERYPNSKTKKEESKLKVKNNYLSPTKQTSDLPYSTKNLRNNEDSKLNKTDEEEDFYNEHEAQIKELNIIKNILFTRLERVNASDFDGELKKLSDEVNSKINASTTKTTKYKFYNNRAKSTNVVNKLGSPKASQNLLNNENNPEDIKSINAKSDAPLIKDSGFCLLDDHDFESIIRLFVQNGESLFSFKYMARKKVKQENDNDFNCQIFVRYDEHGDNLEFVLLEESQAKGMLKNQLFIGSNILNGVNALDLKNKNEKSGSVNSSIIKKKFNPYNSNRNQSKKNITILNTKKSVNFINKDNLEYKKRLINYIKKSRETVRHPLKIINDEVCEAIKLLENNYEVNINNIKESLMYIESLTNLTTNSLDNLKFYASGIKNKISIEKEKVDLSDLIEHAVYVSKAYMKKGDKNIKITYSLGPNVDDFVITDAKKLKQILINLLINSITASSSSINEDNKISIMNTSSINYSNSGIHISVDCKSKRKDVLNFTVSDSGCSMDKQTIEYYNKTSLDEFNEVKGIVICKKLLSNFGSDLKYESNLQLGCKVSFSVSVFEEEEYLNNPNNDSDESTDDIGMVEGENAKQDDSIVNEKAESNNSIVLYNNNDDNKSEINSNNNNNQPLSSQGYKRFSVALGRDVVDDCDLRVIIADDDYELRTIFKNNLQMYASQSKLKFDVIECTDGADLLNALYNQFKANKCVDALLFDENMEFISGVILVEIISILFKRTILPEMKIFMSTEYESAKQYNFLTQLIKPIDFDIIKKHFSLLSISSSINEKDNKKF